MTLALACAAAQALHLLRCVVVTSSSAADAVIDADAHSGVWREGRAACAPPASDGASVCIVQRLARFCTASVRA